MRRTPFLLLASFGLLALSGCDDGGGTTSEADSTADTELSTETVDTTETTETELCGEDFARAAFGTFTTIADAAVQTTKPASGDFLTVVDVPWSADNSYLYLRLLEGTRVPLTDDEAYTSELWDLAINRTSFRLNSGVSGPAAVEVAALSLPFADINLQTDFGAFQSDTLERTCGLAADAPAALITAIGRWWTATSPAESPVAGDAVYVIRRLDGDLIKLEVNSVTMAGDRAQLELHWVPLDTTVTCDQSAAAKEAIGPINTVAATSLTADNSTTPMTFTVDASAGGFDQAQFNPYLYIDLDGPAPTKVNITDVASWTDTEWDFAIKRAAIRINGGDSGVGGVTVADITAASLAEVTVLPGDGLYQSDDFIDDACVLVMGEIGPLTVMGSWYNYDVNTHAVVPAAHVYFMKTTGGRHLKLRVAQYTSAVYKFEWEIL